MVNAIERRDPKTAEVLAAIHTDQSRSRLVDFLSDTLAPATAATPPAARQPR